MCKSTTWLVCGSQIEIHQSGKKQNSAALHAAPLMLTTADAAMKVLLALLVRRAKRLYNSCMLLATFSCTLLAKKPSYSKHT
jgi:hypothetical protein